MSQRKSGYERKPRDSYATPAWVTAALVPHLPVTNGTIWEPAAGSGKMVVALEAAGFDVLGSDIASGTDFFLAVPEPGCRAIITNPPYACAQEFIERGLELMRPTGCVAMLLRTDFDHAKTRQHLFSGGTAFAKKLVLTKRNVWNRKHVGPPTLAYGPIA